MAVRAPELDPFDPELEEQAYRRAAETARPTRSADSARPMGAAAARRVRAVDDAFRGADDAFSAPEAPVRRAPDAPLRGAPEDAPRDEALSLEDAFWAAREAPRSRAPEDSPALQDAPAFEDSDALVDEAPSVAGGVPGRRTITIRGQGAERYYGQSTRGGRRRPPQRVHERVGLKPDRIAMWAVLLGLLLVLVAAMSSHAA